ADGLAYTNRNGSITIVRSALVAVTEPSADLVVDQLETPDPVPAGSALTYMIVVGNNGPSDATGVTLIDTVPMYSHVLATSPGCSFDGYSTVTCEIGSLAAGQTAPIQGMLEKEGGTTFNRGAVAGDQPDPHTADNSASQATNGLYEGYPPTSMLDFSAGRLVWDPVRQRIWASIPSSDARYGNRVIGIDPLSGRIDRSIRVGSEPGPLALSDDGNHLYVALYGAAGIVRVNLDAEQIDLAFPVKLDGNGPYGAVELKTVNGAPGSLAVSMVSNYYDRGTAIYDGAVRRPQIGTARGLDIACSSSGDRLYTSADNSWFGEFRIDAQGLTELRSFPAHYEPEDIDYAQGTLYGLSGEVVDPLSGRRVGLMSGMDPFPDTFIV